ncbi:MAG: hypothetical protein ABI382_03095 [Nakamurella sp.]
MTARMSTDPPPVPPSGLVTDALTSTVTTDSVENFTDDLADQIAASILGDTTDFEAADHLALIQRCQTAESVTKSLTQQAVHAARTAGHSWADIGGELGMSRQAAQQRFGGAPGEIGADERWLGPVTAFDELAELELAGRLGWHTIGAGFLRHRMVHNDTQWQHKRIAWPQSTKSLKADGWQIGCRAFPWIYLIRDTGLPVEKE